MPTPKKTINELKLSGTYQRNPKRYSGRTKPIAAPKAPLGTPPRHLAAPERLIWAEVVKSAPSGLLTRSHRVSVEVLVGLIAKLRAGTIKPGEVNTLINLLSRFGLSPENITDSESAPESETKSAKEIAEEKAWAELDELD